MLQRHCNIAALPKRCTDVMCPVEWAIMCFVSTETQVWSLPRTQPAAQEHMIPASSVFQNCSQFSSWPCITWYDCKGDKCAGRLQVHGDFIKAWATYKNWLTNIRQTPHHFRKYSTIPAKGFNNNNSCIIIFKMVCCKHLVDCYYSTSYAVFPSCN